MRGKELYKLLESNGFIHHHTTGSHRVFKKSGRRAVVVPYSPNEEIKPIMVKVILKQAGIAPSDTKM